MKDKFGITIALSTGIIFGLYPCLSRAVYADGGSVVFIILLTTWIRALMMAGFCWVRKYPLFKTREDTNASLTGGAFQAGSIVAVFAALLYLPGPVVITILFTSTLMLLFFMAARRQATLHVDVVVTTITAIVGIGFVLNVWHAQELNVFGVVIAFVAAILIMSRIYIYGHLTKTRHPIVVGAEAFLVAALLVTPLAFWVPPVLPTTTLGLSYAVLAALSMGIGTFGVFYGISLLGSFKNAMFMKVEPIAAAFFSAALFHEFLTASQYVGIVIVTVSLLVYQFLEQRRLKAI